MGDSVRERAEDALRCKKCDRVDGSVDRKWYEEMLSYMLGQQKHPDHDDYALCAPTIGKMIAVCPDCNHRWSI